MQNAVARAYCKPYVRRRMQSVSLARNHANDVAAPQIRLDLRHLAFWNFIKRPRRDIRFHARKRSEQRLICSKITIMPPASAHLARGMRDTAPAKLTSHIVNQTATIVIVKPVFQIMQPGKVIARALSAAIPVQ